jgi:L-seryl-tRNA(Ser) seleniumtransferase
MSTDARRAIPSVDRLIEAPAFDALKARFPRARIVEGLRRELDVVRSQATDGGVFGDVADPIRYARAVEERLESEEVPSLRPVINATGVILHTNLGRAPLAKTALDAMARAGAGYASLEYDLDAGARGSRYVHCADLLRELTGAEDALVVNNNAAALVLALNTVALGRSVLVSRGELVEIGGSFRVPEILERSGARLREVGSTNRTRVEDYRAALDDDVAAILKVHRSNFRMTGFTEEAVLPALSELARARGVPLLHDLGSGLLLDPARLGLDGEPRVIDSLRQGADVVCFSGDKLLGAPQAGILVGGRELIGRMRQNPLCRALRVDKVTLAGLEATLRLYRDPERALREVPTLALLTVPADVLERRARALAGRMSAQGVDAAVAPSSGVVGGGTCPDVELPSWSVRVSASGNTADALARLLRSGTPPVVGRLEDGRLVLDVRTVFAEEEDALLQAVANAFRGARAPAGGS